MSEVSITKHLSGPEALDSVLAELRKQLRMNGRFQSHMAYQGYVAKLHFEFYPAMSFIPPVFADLQVDEVPEGAILTDLPMVEEDLLIPMRPPNQVREDADMPTPVLHVDGEGKTTEKWVKRQKGVPKNFRKKVKMNGDSPLQDSPGVTYVPTASFPIDESEVEF